MTNNNDSPKKIDTDNTTLKTIVGSMNEKLNDKIFTSLLDAGLDPSEAYKYSWDTGNVVALRQHDENHS